MEVTQWLVVSVLMVFGVPSTYGHGMMMVPINRGSAWRSGYYTPINYDDNANYCGGFAVQWGINNGMCGPCGDDYSLTPPRPNENTGIYGKGVIVATYEQGATIDVSIRITANHKGYFLFSICELSSADDIETNECFEKNRLTLADGSDKYFLPRNTPGTYNTRVVLPADLTCERCVLRWHYETGNNWGLCIDGSGAVGCGAQENFRTCTDISIVASKKE